MKPVAGESKPIPLSVVRRLTKYLALIQGLKGEGVEWVSSQELATALGTTSSTVRQDLSHVDFYGISKRGYATEGLAKVLSGLLGADSTWRMVVAGAGNLGRALALHEEFPRRGFIICGVFDVDPRKIGKKIGRLTVQGMKELPAVVGREKVDMGILAVPSAAAQPAADLLIASGIRGLLNLTLTHVVAPRHVPVVASRIVASVLELAHAVTFGSVLTAASRNR